MKTETEELILSLKNVKIHPDMSDETNCFSASIYLDGKKVGKASNSGRGGCNRYDWNSREVGEKIQKWASIQETRYEFDKLDQIVDNLLYKWEEIKYLKKACKTKTLFRLKGDREDTWRTVKAAWSQAVHDFMKKKYGDKIERIANLELESS